MYLQRSKQIEQHQPGSNAVVVHIILAVTATILIFTLKRLWARRHAGELLLLKPFSEHAFMRFRRTVLLRAGASFANMVRLVVAAFLGIMLAYNFYRGGAQVLGALDPNFTINAWGGPGYIGASLAHWMDAVLLFYIEASLLAVVMLPITVRSGPASRK